MTSGSTAACSSEPSTRRKASGAIFVATHVDVIPPRKDDCIAILKAMSTDTPKDAGNLRYEVLQQPNRTNHFTVTEAWKDKKSLDGHASADHTRQFREKLPRWPARFTTSASTS